MAVTLRGGHRAALEQVYAPQITLEPDDNSEEVPGVLPAESWSPSGPAWTTPVSEVSVNDTVAIRYSTNSSAVAVRAFAKIRDAWRARGSSNSRNTFILEITDGDLLDEAQALLPVCRIQPGDVVSAIYIKRAPEILDHKYWHVDRLADDVQPADFPGIQFTASVVEGGKTMAATRIAMTTADGSHRALPGYTFNNTGDSPAVALASWVPTRVTAHSVPIVSPGSQARKILVLGVHRPVQYDQYGLAIYNPNRHHELIPRDVTVWSADGTLYDAAALLENGNEIPVPGHYFPKHRDVRLVKEPTTHTVIGRISRHGTNAVIDRAPDGQWCAVVTRGGQWDTPAEPTMRRRGSGIWRGFNSKDIALVSAQTGHPDRVYIEGPVHWPRFEPVATMKRVDDTITLAIGGSKHNASSVLYYVPRARWAPYEFFESSQVLAPIVRSAHGATVGTPRVEYTAPPGDNVNLLYRPISTSPPGTLGYIGVQRADLPAAYYPLDDIPPGKFYAYRRIMKPGWEFGRGVALWSVPLNGGPPLGAKQAIQKLVAAPHGSADGYKLESTDHLLEMTGHDIRRAVSPFIVMARLEQSGDYARWTRASGVAPSELDSTFYVHDTAESGVFHRLRYYGAGDTSLGAAFTDRAFQS